MAGNQRKTRSKFVPDKLYKLTERAGKAPLTSTSKKYSRPACIGCGNGFVLTLLIVAIGLKGEMKWR